MPYSQKTARGLSPGTSSTAPSRSRYTLKIDNLDQIGMRISLPQLHLTNI